MFHLKDQGLKKKRFFKKSGSWNIGHRKSAPEGMKVGEKCFPYNSAECRLREFASSTKLFSEMNTVT